MQIFPHKSRVSTIAQNIETVANYFLAFISSVITAKKQR
jgi:hypothetical protein